MSGEVKPSAACVPCRISKVRCEGGIPCERCRRLNRIQHCKPCEVKKRGRKRKMPPPLQVSTDKDAPESPVKPSKMVAPSAPVWPVADVSAPPADAAEVLRTLRDLLGACRNQKPDLKLIFFCEFVRQTAVALRANAPDTIAAECRQLEQDASAIVPVGVSLPLPDDAFLQSEKEIRSIIAMVPGGAAVLQLYPIPFTPTSAPFVTQPLSELLLFSVGELQTLFRCFPDIMR
jgi:hypothetical protein